MARIPPLLPVPVFAQVASDAAAVGQAAIGLEQLAAVVRAQAWRQDDAPGLPPTQSAVLRMLSVAAGELRAGRIAGRLGISAASLSDSLRSLEDKGWIERRSDPQDRRAVLVRLSRSGRRLLERGNGAQHGLASLLAALGEQDLAALLRVSQLLVHQAQEQGVLTGMRTCLGCEHFRPHVSQGAKPHHCAFVGLPFGDSELRADCAEQSPAAASDLGANALRFRQSHPH